MSAKYKIATLLAFLFVYLHILKFGMFSHIFGMMGFCAGLVVNMHAKATIEGNIYSFMDMYTPKEHVDSAVSVFVKIHGAIMLLGLGGLASIIFPIFMTFYASAAFQLGFIIAAAPTMMATTMDEATSLCGFVDIWDQLGRYERHNIGEFCVAVPLVLGAIYNRRVFFIASMFIIFSRNIHRWCCDSDVYARVCICVSLLLVYLV